MQPGCRKDRERPAHASRKVWGVTVVALAYFTEEPHQDDRLRIEQIEKGLVPRGCRLGGATIRAMDQLGKVPCEECPCPRELCGSKIPIPQKVSDRLKKPDDRPRVKNTDTESRRVLRQSFNRKILGT